jgi:hypothetical protein
MQTSRRTEPSFFFFFEKYGAILDAALLCIFFLLSNKKPWGFLQYGTISSIFMARFIFDPPLHHIITNLIDLDRLCSSFPPR